MTSTTYKLNEIESVFCTSFIEALLQYSIIIGADSRVLCPTRVSAATPMEATLHLKKISVTRTRAIVHKVLKDLTHIDELDVRVEHVSILRGTDHSAIVNIGFCEKISVVDNFSAEVEQLLTAVDDDFISRVYSTIEAEGKPSEQQTNIMLDFISKVRAARRED